MGYQINEELWNNSDNVIFNRCGYSERELEANEFAAAFLMPKDEYIRVANENSQGNSKMPLYFNLNIFIELTPTKNLSALTL